jgi:hypothetical protein
VSAVRGRRLTAVAAAALLALAALGCGDDDSGAPQVPGPPASFSVPTEGVTPAGGASAESSSGADSGATGSTGDADSGTTGGTGAPTPEATATPEATGDAGTPTSDPSGGATAPETAQSDGPGKDTAPPDGSNAQQFEDFCAQNPGAC